MSDISSKSPFIDKFKKISPLLPGAWCGNSVGLWRGCGLDILDNVTTAYACSFYSFKYYLFRHVFRRRPPVRDCAGSTRFQICGLLCQRCVTHDAQTNMLADKFDPGEDDHSSTWENDYLKDEQVTTALTTKAVTLRLNAGSQEAGYLAAYYPIPMVPAFIVIQYVFYMITRFNRLYGI